MFIMKRKNKVTISEFVIQLNQIVITRGSKVECCITEIKDNFRIKLKNVETNEIFETDVSEIKVKPPNK